MIHNRMVEKKTFDNKESRRIMMMVMSICFADNKMTIVSFLSLVFLPGSDLYLKDLTDHFLKDQIESDQYYLQEIRDQIGKYLAPFLVTGSRVNFSFNDGTIYVNRKTNK